MAILDDLIAGEDPPPLGERTSPFTSRMSLSRQDDEQRPEWPATGGFPPGKSCPYCAGAVAYEATYQAGPSGEPTPVAYRCAGCAAEFVYHRPQGLRPEFLAFVNGRPDGAESLEPIEEAAP